MTVAEFITWLQTQDQEAKVQCIKVLPGGVYTQGGDPVTRPFTPELSEYTDFRGNQWVNPGSEHYGQRYLLIGEEE